VREKGRGYKKTKYCDMAAEMRLLHWYLKALLEAAQYGLMATEEIFFSHILFRLPHGTYATASEMAGQALASGNPAALPGMKRE
jgi:hypothetical protein